MSIRALEVEIRDHLRSVLPETIEVGLLGGDVREYRTMREDAVILQYRGSSFSTPNPAQTRRMRFEVYVGSKSVRKDGQGGALDLLDTVRNALSGYRFAGAGERDGMLYIDTEDTLLYSKDTSMYWYFTRWTAGVTWTKGMG